MRTVIIAALAALSACALHAARTNVTASTTYVETRVRDATNALPAWTKSPEKPAYTAQEVGAATPSSVQEEVRSATNALPAWTKSPVKPTYTAQEVGAATPQAMSNAVRSVVSTASDYVWDAQAECLYRRSMESQFLYWTPVTNVNALLPENARILEYLEEHKND